MNVHTNLIHTHSPWRMQRFKMKWQLFTNCISEFLIVKKTFKFFYLLLFSIRIQNSLNEEEREREREWWCWGGGGVGWAEEEIHRCRQSGVGVEDWEQKIGL